jgi:hypothetical protein
LGAQVIGCEGESDFENGGLYGEQTWRGMLGRNIEEGRWHCVESDDPWCKPVDDCPVKIDGRGLRRNLRVLVGPNLCPAATHLLHLSAVAMHGAAAGAFLAGHRAARHTGQNGRCRGQQDQERDDAGKAAHIPKYTLRETQQQSDAICAEGLRDARMASVNFYLMTRSSADEK